MISIYTPHPITDVPFTLRDAHIYVEARIDGEGPFPLNIDTGSYMGITGSLAKRLNVKSMKEGLVGGAGAGSERIGLGRLKSVQIGGATLTGLDTMISAGEGSLEAGIGEELFDRYTVEFDNDHHRMRLYPKGVVPALHGAAKLPLQFIPPHKPVIQLDLGRTRGRFMVDTGAGISLILQRRFWQSKALDRRYKPPIQTIVGRGVGGPIFGRVGRIPSLGVGSITLKNPLALYSTMTRGSLADSNRDGIVGQTVMLHFNSVFDYANGQLYLTPNRSFARKDPYSRTGLVGEAIGIGYRIEAVIPNGPAAKAGLRTGDIIVSANGQRIGEDDSAHAALRGPAGKHISLDVLRKDDRFKTTLILRDVL